MADEYFDVPSYDHGERVAKALERIASAEEGKNSAMTSLEEQISNNFIMNRNGKIFRTRFYKFATNTTSDGVKMDDNENMVCVPSTDATEGRDDYADISPFRWYKCNYLRDSDGFARPTVLKGQLGYAESGAVDVGIVHPTFWWTVDDQDTYYDIVISDTPNESLGLKPFSDAVRADGTVMPYFIQSAYMSGTASDGLLRSQPGLAPCYNQSYDTLITDYQKKGAGYWGAGISRNTFWLIMTAIKYGTKSTQSVMKGCTAFDGEYAAAVAETGVKRVLLSSVGMIYAGCCVSLGAGGDRGNATCHNILNRVKVTSIEDVTVSGNVYKALNLDTDSTITTTTSTKVKTMPCMAGETDAVIGSHDGSYLSNADGKHTLRICGQEYSNGQYVVAADTVISFSNASGNKDVYIYPRGTAHVKDAMTGAVKAGSIPTAGDYWIGDEQFLPEYGAAIPGAKGSGDSVGVGDFVWGGGTPSAGSLKAYLMTGYLGFGGHAGGGDVSCWDPLSAAIWARVSCD